MRTVWLIAGVCCSGAAGLAWRRGDGGGWREKVSHTQAISCTHVVPSTQAIFSSFKPEYNSLSAGKYNSLFSPSIASWLCCACVCQSLCFAHNQETLFPMLPSHGRLHAICDCYMPQPRYCLRFFLSVCTRVIPEVMLTFCCWHTCSVFPPHCASSRLQ